MLAKPEHIRLASLRVRKRDIELLSQAFLRELRSRWDARLPA